MLHAKKLDEIDEILNDFVAAYDVKVVPDSDFAYYHGSSIITYAVVISKRMDRLFMEYARTLGLQSNADVFMVSFFHELGHHETLDDFEDEVLDYCLDTKDSLGTTDEDCRLYFDLPDERAATKWAVDFINENAAAVKELWERIRPRLLDFYADNDVH